jgi:GTP cyclohydrolase I
MSKADIFKNSVSSMLTHIGEDTSREGLLDTPHRVLNSYEEIFSGYKFNPHDILKSAMFSSDNQEMVIVKDIEFYSMCEHHMLPMFGKAVVAYIPDGKVIGLSKIPRIVNIFARRLQIQEQLTEQIVDAIYESVKPKGVGAIIDARHMCMEMRGVEKNNSSTVTSSYRGLFLKDKSIKNEFLNFVNSN